MYIKPMNVLFEDRPDPKDMSYLGNVEDNEDPEKLGRVKVRIAPYTDFATEDLPWAYPMLGSCGNSSSNCGLNVPEVGSQVRIVFPSKDLTAPYYTGAELNEFNRTTFFDDNYPNTYGYRDSKGNFMKINKEQGTIHLQHSSTSNVRIAADGSMQVALSNGAYFTFSNYNNFEINVGASSIQGTADGNIDLKATTGINVETGQLDIKADIVAFSGDVKVGTGANGSFWAFNKLVTVKDGIVVSIA